MLLVEFLDRQDGGDLLAFFEREQIDDRLAATVAAALRRFVDLEPVAAATVREAQNVVVRIGDEQVIDVALGNKWIALREGDIDKSVPFGIATYSTVGAVRKIEWRPI